jgi:hypothetical protein
VPRAKYTKPPGPLPTIEQIQHSQFQFRQSQWRKLTKLLPFRLATLAVPSRLDTLAVPPDAGATLPEKVQTMADWVIYKTEEAIGSHLTLSPLISEDPVNPANVRAAISRLREALKPFVRGWVDSETANLVPAALDDKLAAREQEIAKMHLPSAQQRAIAMLCQSIEVFVRHFSTANGETVSKQDMLCYVDAALNFARIKHPDIPKHRDRLAALVFPKN